MPFLKAGCHVIELFPPFTMSLPYQLALMRMNLHHSAVPLTFTATTLSLDHMQDRNLVMQRAIQTGFHRKAPIDAKWLRSALLHSLPTLDTSSASSKTKYLLFQPWEQLNNQLIGFRSACAVASMLERTLVLPYLSFRRDASQRWNFDFAIEAFTWRPMELYYDLTSMKALLPCNVIPYSMFRAVTQNRGTKQLLFNPLFNHTTAAQLQTYYQDVLQLPFQSIAEVQRMDQLSSGKVRGYLGSLTEPVLAFGVAFWLHDFGRKLHYPYREYHDVMDNPLYAQINKGMQPREDLVTAAQALVNNAHSIGLLLVVHARVGQDYELKCGKIRDDHARSRCLPNRSEMHAHILEAMRNHTISSAVSTDESELLMPSKQAPIWLVYVMADQPTFELDPNGSLAAASVHRVFSRIDVVSVFDNLDPIEVSLLEQRIGIAADVFVGNIYSSFSRTVFEQRQLLSKIWSAW
jgi:hypothetical protein